MAKYRVKSDVVVDISEPWTGENLTELQHWESETGTKGTFGVGANDDVLIVGTLEGPMPAAIGDRLVRGTRGEVYPIKPEPFADKYELVEAGERFVDVQPGQAFVDGEPYETAEVDNQGSGS